MKKVIATILLSLLILSAFGSSVFAGGSYFGYGASVVASRVTLVKTGLLGKKLCFTDADFKSALCIGDFDSITVTSIPKSTEGTLLLGGRRVGVGRVIKQKNLGALVFVPASDKVEESGFRFAVKDYAGGAEIECVLKFIGKVNYAPEISEKSSVGAVTTQQSIPVFGRLSATDPEGDGIEYIIVSYPKYGRIDLQEETGRFSYTPNGGYLGKDSFSYVARDEYGNYSEPKRAEVRINERMCSAVYTDMLSREEYNGAVAMTAMGVMDGRLIGDDTYFLPDEELSRAEFVAMALKSRGIKADSTVSKTYYDDDGDIPTSLKGYVATAERLGITLGDFVDSKLVFKPNEPITRYEAAKIMAALLGTEGGEEDEVFSESESIPVWARGGVSLMLTVGIFDECDAIESEKKVTRADAADYLYRLSME